MVPGDARLHSCDLELYQLSLYPASTYSKLRLMHVTIKAINMVGQFITVDIDGSNIWATMGPKTNPHSTSGAGGLTCLGNGAL
ncbi:hypothetical protein G5I_01857 [Acromyrmex echinatior]|uniref:Uncharacterized protein n=1 Tax=Acromyrmex echinatior TaxID=103372 RepID=F4W8S4_ACREC|nr:hypothetical protein G5I_01857 [Acromyrmex echinatior]